VSPRVEDDLDGFAVRRPRLMAIAYRMLGSVVEAEDVVGDVALRWSTADRTEVRSAEAWLVTVTTRRSLDVLRSARLQREEYPGVWLPEPVATTADPAEEVERLESLTFGFLVLLERLTPIERAVFVLHDALEYPYPTIAAAVGRSEEACRQTLHRARRHVTMPRRRSAVDVARAEDIAQQFMTAGFSGDMSGLLAVLAPGITVTSDGGGVVHAAMRPVSGRERVARYLTNLSTRVGSDPLAIACRLNGEPGVLIHGDDGWVAVAVEIVDDVVANIWIVVNPAKLERLVESFGDAAASRPPPADTPARFRHRRGHAVP